MIDRNTLLYDDELETLMLLRINRDFMTFIRENHAHTSKQNFKETSTLEEQNNEEHFTSMSLA